MTNTDYQRNKERRQWLRDHHLCIDCKAEDAFTMMGHARCSDCREKARLRESGRKIPREQWYEMGLCTRCGKNSPEEGFKVCHSCREHYIKMSAISHKDDGPHHETDGKPNPSIPRKEWVANGFCWLCGDKRLPEFRVCQSCRDRLTTQNHNQDLTEQRKSIENLFKINHIYRNKK